MSRSDRGREISFEQVASNISSVFGEGERRLESTELWRVAWWNKIVDYTFWGPNFWTGKGFGVNLADDDGFQVAGGTLRSPHNGHLTILARTGVPGFGLWLALQTVFGGSLLIAFARSRINGDHIMAALSLWVLAYWLAFMVNGSFDVFLEGPQGGIWYWSLFGFGLALLRVYRKRAEPEAGR